MPDESFSITPLGPFSLAEAATFGFGQRDGDGWDGVMRLAFCTDDYGGHVGVEVSQDGMTEAGPASDGTGEVRCVVHRDAAGTDLGAVRRQVARVLSLDHDGAQFLQAGERDPVIGRLQAAAPGLRPPLFYSPYEAAAWCVLSARRPARQMARVRDQLNHAHGAVFDLAGQRLAAFPAPEQLLAIQSFPEIPNIKLQRLHGVAQAALAGQLDITRLQELGPEHALADLQSVSGIGPFYSSLIVVRACGFTDVLPVGEPKVLQLAAQLYGLAEPPAAEQFSAIAEPWRPFRTWACVLIRSAAQRILDAADPVAR
jgi:DNA-3-methyladenine glycosylase II